MATTTSTKHSRKRKQDPAAVSAALNSFWSKAAPNRLRKLSESPEHPDTWAVWRKHLAKRNHPSLGKLLGRQNAVLQGGNATEVESAERIAHLLRCPKNERSSIELEGAVCAWLSRAAVTSADVSFAVECLVWTEALPELAQSLSASIWLQLTQRLVALAASDSTATEPLATLLLHAELPANLSYLLPELAASSALLDAARHTLDEWADQALDASGTLHGEHLARLMPTIASLARVRSLSKQGGRKIWNSDVQRQFESLVEYAWRLTRANGSPMFLATDGQTHRKLLHAALRACKREKTKHLSKAVEKGGDSSSFPPSSWQLEDARLAVLRCDWQRRSPQLAVNHSAAELVTELALGKTDYWNGRHTLEVRVDGELLAPQGVWEQVCWESDGDVDYLELELTLAGDVIVQRHLALARQDQCLVLADAVLGSKPGKIEYSSTLPLAASITFKPEPETREGQLIAENGLAIRVAPLALNEWRNGPGVRGSLETRNGQLHLTQSGEGQNMLVPLFVDLQPRRLKREITWRQLTVGRERKPVAHGEAVGYRIQVGDEQWLFYRAMGNAATRTVLGKNLYNQLLFGRFHAEDGRVTSLVEIEA